MDNTEVIRNQKERNVEKPYLTREDWYADTFLPSLSAEELYENHTIYTPQTIINALEVANYYLTHIPGPNLEKRQLYASSWLEWWINELKDYDGPKDYPYMKGHNVLDFWCMSDSFLVGVNYHRIPAIWFVAGLEGHSQHIQAAEYVLSRNKVFPVIVFEDEDYMKRKSREKFFLPLELKVSMWSHFFRKRGNIALLTYNLASSAPEWYLNKHLSDLYEAIFQHTNAVVSFANADDTRSMQYSKIFRSHYWSPQWLIPHFDGPSTSDRVRV